MPGQVRWHLLEEHVVGEPMAATAIGDLRDTGQGFPALGAAADREAPGLLCVLRPDAVAHLLPLLDRVEGTDGGLFSRQLRRVDDCLAWVYVADACAGWGNPIVGWVSRPARTEVVEVR